MHIVFTIISIIGLLLAIACLALLANTRKLFTGGTDIDQFWPKRRRFMYWTNIFMLIPNVNSKRNLSVSYNCQLLFSGL